VVVSHNCPLVQRRWLDTPEEGQYAFAITRARVVVLTLLEDVVSLAVVVIVVALVVVVVVVDFFVVVVDFFVVVVVVAFVVVVVAFVVLEVAFVVVVVGAAPPKPPLATYEQEPTQAEQVLTVPPAQVPAIAPFCTSHGVFSGSYEHAAFVQPVATPLT